MPGLQYAPDLVPADAARPGELHGLLVGGEERDGSGPPLTVVEPATGEVLATLARAAEGDVDAAVAAARAAQDGPWGSMSGAERTRHLLRLTSAVQEHAVELAVLQTRETGTPVRRSTGVDVPAAVAHLRHHAGWADKVEHAPAGRPSPVRPRGVSAVVLDGGRPLTTAVRLLAPALAAGCAVVLRPDPRAPLTALRLARIALEADLPPGALSVVAGGDDVARALLEHPGVDVVSVAGSPDLSSAAGRAAARGAGLLVESARPATALVLDDAPMDEAVDALVDAAFVDHDPTTGALGRLLVPEPVAGDVVARLQRRAARLRVGDPLDRNTDVGPLACAEAGARLDELARAAVAEGVEIWTADAELPSAGAWFTPTLLSGAAPAHRCAAGSGEGPLLAVLTFRTPAEALSRVGGSPGAVTVWTRDTSRALHLADGLPAGVVRVSTPGRLDPAVPVPGGRSAREAVAAHLRTDPTHPAGGPR